MPIVHCGCGKEHRVAEFATHPNGPTHLVAIELRDGHVIRARSDAAAQAAHEDHAEYMTSDFRNTVQ